MDAPQKIPPDQAAALARRLQTSLKERRPRTRLIILAVVVAVLVVGGLLLWWLYHPQEPVRLEVVAFDAVVTPDETPRVRAQLAFPDDAEHAAALLRGRDVTFLDARALLVPGHKGGQQSAVSDREGRAVAAWSKLGAGEITSISARYVDAHYKQGSSDEASVFVWPKGSKIVLVDVADTLSQIDPSAWETTPPDKIEPRPGSISALAQAKANGHQIGYVAMTPVKALTYRMMRGWVRARRVEAFPPGPVLGRDEYPPAADANLPYATLLKDLTSRFGERITLVANHPATLTQARSSGVRVISIGDAPAGAEPVAQWSDVAKHLKP